MELEKSQTWKNLESALSQEAVAYCEYTFYGQQAAKDGYKQISDIFNETAGNELHHAKLHYKKMHGGKVPGTLDNLKAAAASEDEEVGIYTDYAKTAREEGFADLADFHREEPREPLPAAHRAHRERRGVPPQGSEGVGVHRVRPHRDRHRAPREVPRLRAPAGLL